MWNSYFIKKTLFINKKLELIYQNKFVKLALDKNIKMYVIYIIAFNLKISILLT